MKKIAIFVSGGGTNLQRIAEYFGDNKNVEISLVVCNNPEAYAIKRAKNLDIPVRMIDRTVFKSEDFARELAALNLDLIVLAGFLWLIPNTIIRLFPNKIINIHPALLPKFGGKGFYGEHVHEAVIAANEKESGITIHYVNERYDSGNIIFQATVKVDFDDTPETLAAKIHTLEYEYYPKAIENLLFGNQ